MKNKVLGFLVTGIFTTQICLASQHPVRVDEHTNCVECHAEHVAGDHVHPALKSGCTACHEIENHDDASYVTVQPRESNRCQKCHPSAAVAHPHFPYASGMCTRCHDAHTSKLPGLLRAKVNDLCLDCHLQSAAKHSSRYLPTIELTTDHRLGHPYARHPVSGSPDPLSGEEMSCISCHLPHGGNKLHQLKMGAEIPEDALNHNTETRDMCEKCHMKLWGIDGSGERRHKSSKGIKARLSGE